MSYLYKISSIKKWASITGNQEPNLKFINSLIPVLGKLNDSQKIEIDKVYTECNVKECLEKKEQEDYLRRDAEFREQTTIKKRIPKLVSGSSYPRIKSPSLTNRFDPLDY